MLLLAVLTQHQLLTDRQSIAYTVLVQRQAVQSKSVSTYVNFTANWF